MTDKHGIVWYLTQALRDARWSFFEQRRSKSAILSSNSLRPFVFIWEIFPKHGLCTCTCNWKLYGSSKEKRKKWRKKRNGRREGRISRYREESWTTVLEIIVTAYTWMLRVIVTIACFTSANKLNKRAVCEVHPVSNRKCLIRHLIWANRSTFYEQYLPNLCQKMGVWTRWWVFRGLSARSKPTLKAPGVQFRAKTRASKVHICLVYTHSTRQLGLFGTSRAKRSTTLWSCC